MTNNSDYTDNEVYVAVVGITGGHVWVDPISGQVHQMRSVDNTVSDPVIGENQEPGNQGLYANCFRKLSDISSIKGQSGCQMTMCQNDVFMDGTMTKSGD